MHFAGLYRIIISQSTVRKNMKLVVRTYDWLKATCGVFKKRIACVGLR